MSRDAYLARYDDDRKYSALAGDDARRVPAPRTASPTDRVYVFGFTCAAYVDAERASASRFFWSRPVIVGFNDGRPGYGVEGLLADLNVNRPAVVALQQRDWAPDVDDSAAFFMTTPRSPAGCAPHYVPATGPTASTSGCDGAHAVSAPAPLDARRFAGWLLLITLAALACACRFPPPIRRGTPRSASSGTTKARGSTTRATRRSSARGAQDAWNPMFIAPVFTGLEYVSFALFGVGVWQARLVSELTGLASVAAAGARRAAASPAARPGSSPARCSRPTTST